MSLVLSFYLFILMLALEKIISAEELYQSVFTTSPYDIERFHETFDFNYYNEICQDYSQECYDYCSQYQEYKFIRPDSVTSNFLPNSNNNIAQVPIHTNSTSNQTPKLNDSEIKYNQYLSEVLFKYSEFQYYGVFSGQPNLQPSIRSFIVSAFFGNPGAYYKLFILLDSNIYSFYYIKLQELTETDPLLHYALVKENFLNNFNFEDNYEKQSLANLLLYISALNKHPSAVNTLGYKYKKGNGFEKSCETALKYYRDQSISNLKHFEKLNKPKFIEKINLVSLEYPGLKYTGLDTNIDMHQIIEYYKLEAKKGLISYISQLGQRYLYGQDVPQDFEEAAHYFETGAGMNDTTCQYYLGEMYLNGWYFEKNYTRAFELFKESESFSKSVNTLGFMHYYGYGVEKNIRKAYDYFQRAILLEGDADSYHNILSLLLEDNGTTIVDVATAYKYANILSSKAHTFGTYMFAAMNDYKIGSSLESCDVAIEYYKTVAERNTHSLYKYNLSIKTYKEGNVKGSSLANIELAEEGHVYSDTNTGLLFYNYNIFTNQTFNEYNAFKYFERQTKSLDPMAYLYLADMYYLGNNFVPQNYTKAFFYYTKSSKLSMEKVIRSHSYFNMAYMKYHGYGTTQNYTKFDEYLNSSLKYDPLLYLPVSAMKTFAWVENFKNGEFLEAVTDTLGNCFEGNSLFSFLSFIYFTFVGVLVFSLKMQNS